MAEIMEEKKELTPAETAAPASPETPAKKPEKSTADKKKRRRTIRRIVALVVVAALIAGGVKLFRGKGRRQQRGRHGDGGIRRHQLRGGRQRSGEGQEQRDHQPDHRRHRDGCVGGGGRHGDGGPAPLHHRLPGGQERWSPPAPRWRAMRSSWTASKRTLRA